MHWSDLTVYLIGAMVVCYVPGLLVAAAARAKPAAAFAIAPAISVLIIAATAIGAQKVGVRFALLPVLVASVLVAALVFGAGNGLRILARRFAPEPLRAFLLPSRTPRPRRRAWWLHPDLWNVVAVLVGAYLMARTVARIIVRPAYFSQMFDNVFHLNAIRWILDTGDGSSLTLEAMNRPQPALYPAGWHDTVALALLSVGRDNVVYGTAAVIFVTACVVWTSGCVYLVRSLLPAGPATQVGAAILAVSFPTFPVLLLGFGVLYPNYLGMCLVPAVVACTVAAFGVSPGTHERPGTALVIGVLGLMGAVLAYPTTLFAYFFFLGPILAVWLGRALRGTLRISAATSSVAQWHRRGWVLLLARAAFVAVCALAMAKIWQVVRPPDEAGYWGPYQSEAASLGDALRFTPYLDAPAWPLTIAVAFGAYAVVRRGHNRWLLATQAIVGFLWLIATSWPFGNQRTVWTGIWYNDHHRVAALLPLAAIPLASLGVAHAVGAVRRWVESGPVPAAQRLLHTRWGHTGFAVASAIVAVAVLIPATQQTLFRERAIFLASTGPGRTLWTMTGWYPLNANAPLVTPDKYAVMQRAKQVVPPGVRVAANPWNGSAMVYGLTGVKPTVYHFHYEPSPAQRIIHEHLADVATMPQVCDAVRELNVGYAFDFGRQEIWPDMRHPEFYGLTGLAGKPGFAEVVRRGDAALYRVTACG